MPASTAGGSCLPREILKWLQSLDLSFTVKNARRDFANGFLLAEVLSRFWPADISLHSFSNVASSERKAQNWALLWKLFTRKGIPVERTHVDAVMAAKPDAAVELLQLLYGFINGGDFQFTREPEAQVDQKRLLELSAPVVRDRGHDASTSEGCDESDEDSMAVSQRQARRRNPATHAPGHLQHQQPTDRTPQLRAAPRNNPYRHVQQAQQHMPPPGTAEAHHSTPYYKHAHHQQQQQQQGVQHGAWGCEWGGHGVYDIGGRAGGGGLGGGGGPQQEQSGRPGFLPDISPPKHRHGPRAPHVAGSEPHSRRAAHGAQDRGGGSGGGGGRQPDTVPAGRRSRGTRRGGRGSHSGDVAWADAAHHEAAAPQGAAVMLPPHAQGMGAMAAPFSSYVQQMQQQYYGHMQQMQMQQAQRAAQYQAACMQQPYAGAGSAYPAMLVSVYPGQAASYAWGMGGASMAPQPWQAPPPPPPPPPMSQQAHGRLPMLGAGGGALGSSPHIMAAGDVAHSRHPRNGGTQPGVPPHVVPKISAPAHGHADGAPVPSSAPTAEHESRSPVSAPAAGIRPRGGGGGRRGGRATGGMRAGSSGYAAGYAARHGGGGDSGSYAAAAAARHGDGGAGNSGSYAAAAAAHTAGGGGGHARKQPAPGPRTQGTYAAVKTPGEAGSPDGVAQAASAGVVTTTAHDAAPATPAEGDGHACDASGSGMDDGVEGGGGRGDRRSHAPALSAYQQAAADAAAAAAKAQQAQEAFDAQYACLLQQQPADERSAPGDELDAALPPPDFQPGGEATRVAATEPSDTAGEGEGESGADQAEGQSKSERAQAIIARMRAEAAAEAAATSPPPPPLPPARTKPTSPPQQRPQQRTATPQRPTPTAERAAEPGPRAAAPAAAARERGASPSASPLKKPYADARTAELCAAQARHKTEMAELEEQHRADQAKVDSIKAELARLLR